MGRPPKHDRPQTAIERMRASRERRAVNERRIELTLPNHVLHALDALADKRKVSRAKVIEDLALSGLHAAPDVAGIAADPDSILPRVRAVHEVGHALAGMRYGYSLQRVTILPKRGFGGYAASKPAPVRAFRITADADGNEAYHLRAAELNKAEVRREVFHLMAGYGAEQAFFTVDDESVRLASAASDIAAARELVRTHVTSDPVQVEAFIARELALARKWASSSPVRLRIEKLAKLLVERSTMTGDEVRAALRELP